jgi:glycosyltransferase involved in cell wall biosynthesis
VEEHVVRVLGVQIANGYSSEARVFAGLLAQRTDDCDALVLHHDWHGDRGSATEFQTDGRVRVERVDTGWRPNPAGRRSAVAKVWSRARFLVAQREMVRTARGYDPDVVFSCQQKWDNAAAASIARRLGRPLVVELHYIIGPWLGRSTLRSLLTCDHVITVSDFIRDEALRHGVPPERVTTIRNTMRPFAPAAADARPAVRAELGIAADTPLIGIVARVDPGKGHEDTIAAFARVAAAHPAARLLIVGDGTMRTSLEAMAAATGLGDRIQFTGRRPDVPRVLSALDIFIHPSRQDPCPLGVLEAAAAGLPVVAFAEGGIREIVADGETGLLSPPEDVDALAASLQRLLSEPELAQRMGRAGRERIATQFRPEAAGEAFSAVLRQVAGTRSQAGPLAVPA